LRNGWRKDSTARQPAFIGNQNGDAKAAVASAAKKVEAVYNYPYQNHATMEPLNATALYTRIKCEVWCGTPNGEAAFAATLEAFRSAADKCEVHKQILGGGFGRRGQTDYVRRPSRLPSKCRALRSSCCGRAKKTCSTALYHRSRSAN